MEVMGIEVEMKPGWQPGRKERAAPGFVTPARGSYEDDRL
jgi:hypothetical protein